MSGSHKDVEFHVSAQGTDQVFKEFDKACAAVVTILLCRGIPVTLDFVISSEEGAAWFEGDEGVAQYREDPEASVFRRVIVNPPADLGRVP